MSQNNAFIQNMIYRKFKEFNELFEKHPQKCEKKIKEVEKLESNEVAAPWIQTMKMMYARKNNDKDTAIENARKLIASNNVTLSYETAIQVLTTCQAFAALDDMNKAYKSLGNNDSKKNSIALELTIPDYKSAQTTAMDVLRNENTPEHICIAALCSYLKAKSEKAPIFYQFCLRFLDKIEAGKHTNGTAEIKADCLIEMGKPQDAIDFLNSKEIVELYGKDDLVLRREIIRAYTAMEKYDEVALCAEKFLDEYNADSIDEWRLVVKYSKNPKEIIEKHKDGKKRGPYLAEIDLALKNNEDITNLLLEYAERYKSKNCVFGDLKKYLTPEVCGKLQSIADPATRAFCTGKIDFEPTDGRLAAVVGEYYLMQYLNTKDVSFLNKAIDTVELFPEHHDCQFLLIRIIGISGCTFQERVAWDKLRLEAIQVFSLAGTLALDFVNSFSIRKLKDLFDEAELWYSRSVVSFYPAITKAFRNLELRQVESMANFAKQIRTHIMRKFYCAFAVYESLLHKKPQHFYLDELESLNDAEIFVQNDSTVLPIYFNDDKLRNAIYPSIEELATTLSDSVQYLANMHFGNTEKAETALKALKATNSWKSFVAYVDSGFETIPDAEETNLFELGAIIICSNEAKKIDAQKADITKVLNKVIATTKAQYKDLHPMLEKFVKDDIQEFNASTKVLKDLLK